MKVDPGKAAQCCWHVCDLKIEQDTKMSENVLTPSNLRLPSPSSVPQPPLPGILHSLCWPFDLLGTSVCARTPRLNLRVYVRAQCVECTPINELLDTELKLDPS
jgi:hypothetical protein